MNEADQIKALTAKVERLSGVVAALESLLSVSLDLDEMTWLRAQALLCKFDYTDPIKPPFLAEMLPAALATEELHKIREIAARMKELRPQN